MAPKKPAPPLPEQLPDEPDCSYSLFCEYCQSGSKRSIRALSELTGRSRPVLGSLSVRWQWPARAAAWDRSAALAPDPKPESLTRLGDRRARIAAALDSLIDLLSDKIQSSDPLETPARSISGLVSSLSLCLEMAESLEPPPFSAEMAAIETLLGSRMVDPRIAAQLAAQTEVIIRTFKGNLDAALATNDFDDLGDGNGAIDVQPHI